MNSEGIINSIVRLKPGDDLYESIVELSHKFESGSLAIVTCVGSLSKCLIRLAGANPTTIPTKEIEGPLEIVSLVGTVVQNHPHLHISVANTEGSCFGGHLLKGSIVHTTVELVVMELEKNFHVKLVREPDEITGYNELKVYPK